MKRMVILAACLAVAGLAAAATAQTKPNPNAPGAGNDAFVSDANARTFAVEGTVVRTGGGSFTLRIDDHGHALPFRLATGVEAPAVGSRVGVTYHPTGPTGQAAVQVQLL